MRDNHAAAEVAVTEAPLVLRDRAARQPASDALALKKTSWFTPGVAGEVVNDAVGGVPGATGTVCTDVAVAPRLSVTVNLTRKLPTVRNWCVVI